MSPLAIGVDCNINVPADHPVPGRDMAVVANAHGSSVIKLLRPQTTLQQPQRRVRMMNLQLARMVE